MKKIELQQKLRELNQLVSGNKPELIERLGRAQLFLGWEELNTIDSDVFIGIETEDEDVKNSARNEAYQEEVVDQNQVITSPSKLELDKSIHEKEMEMLWYEQKANEARNELDELKKLRKEFVEKLLIQEDNKEQITFVSGNKPELVEKLGRVTVSLGLEELNPIDSDVFIGIETKDEDVENSASNDAYQEEVVDQNQVITSPSKAELDKSIHEMENEILEDEQKTKEKRDDVEKLREVLLEKLLIGEDKKKLIAIVNVNTELNKLVNSTANFIGETKLCRYLKGLSYQPTLIIATEIIRTYGRVKPKINRGNMICEGCSITSVVDQEQDYYDLIWHRLLKIRNLDFISIQKLKQYPCFNQNSFNINVIFHSIYAHNVSSGNVPWFTDSYQIQIKEMFDKFLVP